MPFQKLVTPSLTDLFVSQMESMILSGELKPGEQLPTERELAARTDVSLAVVHSGITRLAEAGFLRVAPRKGVYVTDYLRTGNLETLNAILKYRGSIFSKDLFLPTMTYLQHLMDWLLEAASRECGGETWSALEQILDDYRKSIRQTEAAELAFRFYHETAVGCGSYVYPYLTAAAKDLITQCFASSIRILGKDPFLPPLEETLAALREPSGRSAGSGRRSIPVPSANRRLFSIFGQIFYCGKRIDRIYIYKNVRTAILRGLI